MSYSFSVTGTTKREVTGKIVAELTKVVDYQPAHRLDMFQAQTNAEAVVALMGEPPAGQQYYVYVAGSIYAPDTGVQQVSIQAQGSFTVIEKKLDDPNAP